MSLKPQPVSLPPANAEVLHVLKTRELRLILAQRVTQARQLAGLTQLELAKLAELSRGTVHLIEAGLCDSRLSTVVRLANALEVDPLSLLDKPP